MPPHQTHPLLPFPGIALLTWFGTIACLDRRQNKLVHVGFEALAPWHMPLGLRPEPVAGAALYIGDARLTDVLAALPPIIICGGAQANCVTLYGGQNFMVAKPEGLLEVSSPQAREWENFMPVPARDVMLLQRLTKDYWSVNGAAPVRAGFGEFRLKFDEYFVDMVDNLPIRFGSNPGGIVLTTPQGVLQVQHVPGHVPPKQVWIKPLGNIGNRALQYLTAASIAARVPGAAVRNIHLEIWGRVEPAPRPGAAQCASTGVESHLDVEGLADCLRRGEVDAVCIDWYPFHLDHYPSRETCRALFPPAIGKADVQGFGRHELVCSIRGAEILRAHHPDYFPLPPGYYAKLQQETGLDLVFYGQIEDDPYSQVLRAAFPKARFVPGIDQNHDFEVLRRSVNVALSISTFAWLAAWLGEAERIYLPVGGMFNPVQHPGQLYLPLNEPAFRYVLLPPVKAVNPFEDIARFWLMQETIAVQARPIGVEELREMLVRAGKLGNGKIPVRGFDGASYLANDPEAMAQVRMGHTTALGHYLSHGYLKGARHRPFDPLFYASTYPDAAEAVALGHYPSLWRHFLEAGEALGHAPVP